jgi:integrase
VSGPVQRLVEYLRARGARENTIKTYARYAEWLVAECSEVTLDCVQRFLAGFSDKAPLTRSTVAYAVRAFLEANPQLGVDYRLVPLPERVESSRRVVVIPEEEVRRIAESEDLKTGTIIALMYEFGLRVSEVGKILCGDVNLENWTVYVRRTKGSVSAELPVVTPWVKSLLRAYMTARRCESPGEPLFPSKKGAGISHTRVSIIVKEALKRHGYPTARPHDIRHSRATNLLRAGVDVVTVSRVLGHKSLASTTSYLHLLVEDIRKKLEEASKTRS